jgi:CxxH/CxxC protein (TIGR04129 family)
LKKGKGADSRSFFFFHKWIKGVGPMFICCEEHVDIAIDMYVDETEQAPNISLIPVDNSDQSCDFCENKAVYIVGN